MFTDMDVTTLQQQIAEAQPGEKVLYCMELARRFRDGIGVEQDEEEALFWENYGRTEEAIPQETEVVSDDSVIEICDNPEVLSGAAAYRSYCTGEPAGIYSYAAYLDQKGEKRQAEEIYQELIVKLEQGMGVDYDYHSSRSLLTKAKYAMGRVCAEDQTKPDAQKKAISYTEEAVLELNYYQGLPQLIALYRQDGLDKHEKKLLPMLEKMEDGNVDQRLVALDTYCELERWGLASAVAVGLLTEETTRQIWVHAAASIEDLLRRCPKLARNPESWAGCNIGQLIRKGNLEVDPQLRTHYEVDLDFTAPQSCESVSNYTLRRLIRADNLYAMQIFAQRIWEVGDYRSVFEILSRACTLIETEANVVGVGDPNCAGVIYWLRGSLYERGWGCRANAKKAFESVNLAAVKYGNQDARFHLFTLYRDGLGTEKDLDEATRVLTKYAEAGSLREQAKAADCFASIGKNANAEIWGQIVLQDGSDPKAKADALRALQKIGGEDNQGKPVTAEYIADMAEQNDGSAILAEIYAAMDTHKEFFTDRTDLTLQQGELCPGIIIAMDGYRNAEVDLCGMGMGVIPMGSSLDANFHNGKNLDCLNNRTIGDEVLVRLNAYDTETGIWNLRYCEKRGFYDYAKLSTVGQSVLEKIRRLAQVDERLMEHVDVKSIEKQTEKCSAMASAAKRYRVLMDAKNKRCILEQKMALKNGILLGKPVDLEVLVREVDLDSSDPWGRAAALYTLLITGEPDLQGRRVTAQQIEQLIADGDPTAIMAKIEQLKVNEYKIMPSFLLKNQMLQKGGTTCGIVSSIDNVGVTFSIGPGLFAKVRYETDCYSQAVRNLSVGDYAELIVQQGEDPQNQIISASLSMKTGQLDFVEAVALSNQLMFYYRLLCDIDQRLAEIIPMKDSIMWNQKLQVLQNSREAFAVLQRGREAKKKKNRFFGGCVIACLLFLVVLFFAYNPKILMYTICGLAILAISAMFSNN